MKVTPQEIQDFIDDNKFNGAFRQKIASWSNTKEKFNLVIYLVTAKNNFSDSPNYDESVNYITGSHYEILFNDRKYTRDFDSEVKGLVKALLLDHIGESDEG